MSAVGAEEGRTSGAAFRARWQGACWLRRRVAFTLVELLVVVAIVAILAAILMPVFAVARDQARAATCQSNLRQLGAAFLMYVGDYDGVFPPVSGWKTTLQPYIKSTNINRCPSRPELPWYYGQGYNIGCALPPVPGFPLRSEATIVAPASKILCAEWERCNAGPPCGPAGLLAGGATSYWAVCRVHRGGSNVLFGDGHVRWLRPDVYHSNTDHLDGAGYPVAPDGGAVVPVAETTWRAFWDTSYEP